MSDNSTLTKCESIVAARDADDDWLEMRVIGPFRVWQLIFFVISASTIVIVVLCCIFRCRIPRTKQEIEADFLRRRITRAFESHLNRIPIEEFSAENTLLPVLRRVQQLEASQASFDATGGGKTSLVQRFKRIFRTEKVKESVVVEPKEMTDDERRAKQTEEIRMKSVDCDVQNAKIDANSFSIFDHITVLEPKLMKNERKKLEKQKQKEEKQMKKEEKQREKEEKQREKQEKQKEKEEKQKEKQREKLEKQSE